MRTADNLFDWLPKDLGEPVLAEARAQQAPDTQEQVRHFGEVAYQAESWSRTRRVVIKAELLEKGPNVRCVVTNRTEAPEAL